MKLKRKLKRIINLSFIIGKYNFKEKNEGSYLGILWYLLNPLLLFALLLIIFSTRLGTNIENYPLYLLLGIIMFNLFQKITTESSRQIYENHFIIKAINFPREALVGGIVYKNLLGHVFEVIIFIFFMIIFKTSLWGILLYPFILTLFILFIFGFSLILASLTVYFIDLENIWSFASRLLWFATPLFYSVSPNSSLHYLNLFNPLYYFISIGREILIYSKTPSLWMVLIAFLFSLSSFLLGIIIFNKLKIKFAEKI